MHQALPYKTFHLSTAAAPTATAARPRPRPFAASSEYGGGGRDMEEDTDIRSMVSQNPVIVIGRRGCCMGHVVKRLLLSLGVNPAVYEVDDETEEEVMSDELMAAAVGSTTTGGGGGGGRMQFPAVFIGGRLFGGLDRVMATHISGELTPILKEAGALWL